MTTSNTLDVLEVVLLVACASSFLATLVLHFTARQLLHGQKRARSRPLATSTPLAPISVLKPLCGLDEDLYENLLSIVQQDYPAFEVIFGVTDPSDPALRVVRRLLHEHPEVAMRVVVRPARASAANPKIANLLNMLRVASHEHLLISDSNVRATPDYLRQLASAMDEPGVALVSNVIIGESEASLGASLENLHLNTFVAAGVCMADVFGRPVVIGKSMLMRRSELTALGGLASMRDVLAEDYVLGQRYASTGQRVTLCAVPVTTHNRKLSLRRFLQRHLRWAQLRRWVALDAYACEPLLYPTPWLVAPALYSARFLPLTAGLLALRLVNDAYLARTVSGRWPPLSALACLPLKDALLLLVWVIALFRRTVEWRGNRLRIGAGTRVSRTGRGSSLRPGTAIAAR